MSIYEEAELLLYAMYPSEIFKSFKLKIISNNRSNFLSSEKLDTNISFEGSLFYVDDYDSNRPSLNVSFKADDFDFSEGELKGSLEDVSEKRFEPKYTDDDTRGPSPYMQFELNKNKKVNDEDADYSGRLVDKIPGFKAVTYSMNCWIRETETGNKSLEGTLIMTKEN